MAAAQVEELTRQLEQFSVQALQAQAHPGSKAYFVQLHLERLRAELMVPRRHCLSVQTVKDDFLFSPVSIATR